MKFKVNNGNISVVLCHVLNRPFVLGWHTSSRGDVIRDELVSGRWPRLHRLPPLAGRWRPSRGVGEVRGGRGGGREVRSLEAPQTPPLPFL